MPAHRWVLYVDESGQFREIADTVLVGGLLVSNHALWPLQDVRKRLEQRLPWMPWPLHGYEYNVPVFSALLAAAFPEPDVTPAAALRAAVWLLHAWPAELKALAAVLQSGRRVEFEALRALDRFVQRNPTIYGPLVALRRQICATISLELNAFRPSDPAKGGSVYVFLAGETTPGDAIVQRAWGKPADDRFLSEVGCLSRRVTDALVRRGDDHRVDVHILGRTLTAKDGRSIALTAAIVQHAIDEAARGEPRVQWVVQKVHTYDAHVPAALVLADFSVNVARRRLRYDSVSLASALGALEKTLQVPLRFRPTVPSHLTATGLAQQWVDFGLGRAPAPADPLLPPAAGRRRWACEQAHEWLTAGPRGATL